MDGGNGFRHLRGGPNNSVRSHTSRGRKRRGWWGIRPKFFRPATCSLALCPFPPRRPYAPSSQLLADETEELLTTSLTAMRADIESKPAWSGAPPPTDDFLLMFLRSEVFAPSAAAERYRKFWEVRTAVPRRVESPTPPASRPAD